MVGEYFPEAENPFEKRRKFDGRRSDLNFIWFTKKHGNQWQAWRDYAADYLREKKTGLSHARTAIALFFERYLVARSLPHDPAAFFALSEQLPDPLMVIRESYTSKSGMDTYNYIVEFINWVIAQDFTKLNDHGVPVSAVVNPFKKKLSRELATETVYNPLPYRYIQELRSILCPNPQGHFRDWTWAIENTGRPEGQTGPHGDWIEVNPSVIDPDDPDCVWRERTVRRSCRRVTITQLWFPGHFVALLMKLLLPLRTYQVRMLDSGEADTWRYDRSNWLLNRSPMTLGTERAPYQGGVFRRLRDHSTGTYSVGLYINTNKTADQNKNKVAHGYVVPWQHEQALYWLEKMRNWQEKYNPIQGPVLWTELKPKHTGVLQSKQKLEDMGRSCFLFRDASGYSRDRELPICDAFLKNLWYRMLWTLEERVAERGETLADGNRLRFTSDYDDNVLLTDRKATLFPLHALRVSLITALMLDGNVPLPVVSKLLAGHSRLLMTIYYTKFNAAQVTRLLNEAEAQIEANKGEGFKVFLAQASLDQITSKTAFHDEASVVAALDGRNPVGWEPRSIGLCLAGGNTVRTAEAPRVPGCWNGGERIRDNNNVFSRVYGPVPHGLENCVRCRWLITDARYLDALRAHFNLCSFRASEAANLAVELETRKEAIEDARNAAEVAGVPFTRSHELQEATRRYEKQLVEADEYAKDMLAAYHLIARILHVETSRDDDDTKQKFILAGSMEDIEEAISITETTSEMWQLSDLCEDAEFYPDLADDLRKTNAIEKRSRKLNELLMREGWAPIFMTMDDTMQLVMGNAFMQAMARQANPNNWRVEGLRRVSGIIEAGGVLKETGLLDAGIASLAERDPLVVGSKQLRELTPRLTHAGD